MVVPSQGLVSSHRAYLGSTRVVPSLLIETVSVSPWKHVAVQIDSPVRSFSLTRVGAVTSRHFSSADRMVERQDRCAVPGRSPIRISTLYANREDLVSSSGRQTECAQYRAVPRFPPVPLKTQPSALEWHSRCLSTSTCATVNQEIASRNSVRRQADVLGYVEVEVEPVRRGASSALNAGAAN